MTRRAVEIHGDLVLLDGGGDFHVEDRINSKWINEIDIATSEVVVVAAHSHLSGQQVNASEKDGVVKSAAHTHVRFGLKSDRWTIPALRREWPRLARQTASCAGKPKWWPAARWWSQWKSLSMR